MIIIRDAVNNISTRTACLGLHLDKGPKWPSLILANMPHRDGNILRLPFQPKFYIVPLVFYRLGIVVQACGLKITGMPKAHHHKNDKEGGKQAHGPVWSFSSDLVIALQGLQNRRRFATSQPW